MRSTKAILAELAGRTATWVYFPQIADLKVPLKHPKGISGAFASAYHANGQQMFLVTIKTLEGRIIEKSFNAQKPPKYLRFPVPGELPFYIYFEFHNA